MKIKSEKGSITLLVLTACLFFIVAVTTVGMHIGAKRIAVDREYRQIKESYEKDLPNINEIYNELKQIDEMPVRFSIPDINENEKNITISFSLHNPNANIKSIKYGWLSSEEEITPSSSDITDWVYLEDTNSENTIVAKSKYTDDKDYYYLCVMINNKEFWPKAPVKASADASYYGDQIDYDVDLGNNADGNPLNLVGTADYDWEIFLNDGTNIYLIAEDYVLLSSPLMPTNLGNSTALINTKPYCFKWNYGTPGFTKSGTEDIWGIGAPKGTKYIADRYLIKWKEQFLENPNPNVNNNAKIVAALLDTSSWVNFTNSNKVRQISSRANMLMSIGGPTIEMWVKSWNKKYGNISNNANKVEIYYTATRACYYVGTTEEPTDSGVNLRQTTGYNDKLYYSRKGPYGGCYAYWLAAPESKDWNTYNIKCDGNINYYAYDVEASGVRPVVCLPSDITAEWDGANNVWRIIKKAF